MFEPFTRRPARPRLLVSVRSAAEAIAAIAADVIDVKDPAAGALGAASPAVWSQVLAAVRGRRPVTLALGEAADWDEVAVPAVPEGVTAVKLGPRGGGECVAETRRRFDVAAGRPLRWVRVGYADEGPAAESVIDAAAADGSAAVLFDTVEKSKGRLTDWLSAADRSRLRVRAADAGLAIAWAGRLDLPGVAAVAPAADVVGVRSAACGGDRAAEVTADGVAACLSGVEAAVRTVD